MGEGFRPRFVGGGWSKSHGENLGGAQDDRVHSVGQVETTNNTVQINDLHDRHRYKLEVQVEDMVLQKLLP